MLNLSAPASSDIIFNLVLFYKPVSVLVSVFYAAKSDLWRKTNVQRNARPNQTRDV